MYRVQSTDQHTLRRSSTVRWRMRSSASWAPWALMIAFGLVVALSSFAEPQTTRTAPTTKTATKAGDKKHPPSDRANKLDFDDSLIEGVNKQPLDSLAQISDADKKRKRRHLYMKRSGYDSETKLLVKELKLTP